MWYICQQKPLVGMKHYFGCWSLLHQIWKKTRPDTKTKLEHLHIQKHSALRHPGAERRSHIKLGSSQTTLATLAMINNPQSPWKQSTLSVWAFSHIPVFVRRDMNMSVLIVTVRDTCLDHKWVTMKEVLFISTTTTWIIVVTFLIHQVRTRRLDSSCHVTWFRMIWNEKKPKYHETARKFSPHTTEEQLVIRIYLSVHEQPETFTSAHILDGISLPFQFPAPPWSQVQIKGFFFFFLKVIFGLLLFHSSLQNTIITAHSLLSLVPAGWDEAFTTARKKQVGAKQQHNSQSMKQIRSDSC